MLKTNAVKYVAFQANVCIRKRICRRKFAYFEFHCRVRTIFYNKCFTINCVRAKKIIRYSVLCINLRLKMHVQSIYMRVGQLHLPLNDIVLINLYQDLRAQSSRNLRTGLIMIAGVDSPKI